MVVVSKADVPQSVPLPTPGAMLPVNDLSILYLNFIVHSMTMVGRGYATLGPIVAGGLGVLISACATTIPMLASTDI
jgi:hypothetical protein